MKYTNISYINIECIMNKIKELRKQSSIKQIELCKKLNISQGTLSLWENSLFEPDQKSLFLLCEIFNVSIDYLLGRSDYPREPVVQGSFEEMKLELKRLGIDGDLQAQSTLLKKISSLSKEQKQLIVQMIDNFKDSK